MRTFFIILCCIVSCKFVYSASSDTILNHADSLVFAGEYEEVIAYLLPLESEFEEETAINKYHYYGLISGYYLRKNDYHSAIPYLEKQAQYNLTRIDDLLYLVNLFSTDNKFLDRSKAEYYARKALLIEDEGNIFSYTKDCNNQQIGRLHYISGALAARSGNLVISKSHLNWVNENGNAVDVELINHLQALIDSISTQSNIIRDDTIRSNSYRIIKESIANNGVSLFLSNQFYKENNDDFMEDMDSIDSISDVSQYLRKVFYIEDKYGEDDINKSLSLLRKACEVSNLHEFYKTPSSELCELYMRLGRAYFYLKRYDSAIKWLLLSYSQSRKLSDGLFYSVQALGEISDVYLEKGVLYKSILYADEMLENIVNLALRGDINSTALLYLSRYANVLSNTGNDYLAEDFYKIVIESAPKQSQAYNLACNNYATHLFLRDKIDEALYYYSLIKDAFPTPQTISNLAIAYLVLDRISDAEKVYYEYYEKNLAELENILHGFTETTWENYWKKRGYEFYITSNYLASNIATKESLINGYNACVLSKSLPLVYKNSLKKSLSSSVDTIILEKYDRYKMYQRELSSPVLSFSDKKHISINLSEVEDSLFQRMNPNNKLRLLINDYYTVANSLKQDEIAIEFCQYIDILDSQSKYGAYIISPEYESPIFVVIGDEIELSNTIFYAQNDELTINELYSNSDIGDYIWNPIMPYLKNKRKIYFSPIGELSLLNHQLLRTGDFMLGDMYEMRRVSSTNFIVDYLCNEESNYSDIALYGDINYNSIYNDLTTLVAQSSDGSTSSNQPQINIDVRSGWAQLQHSKQEIDSIQSIIQKHNLNSILYLGSNASEAAFKALEFNVPSIIHVATHGFTYYHNDEIEKREKITSVSPHTLESILMSWTGLLFAGANNNLFETSSLQNPDDGILTANEISQLHLDGANLVVLSACNSGLGINDSFGLTIGLQKAFKMAGAKSILMSLWQVPDESTALLMAKFYEALFNRHNRHEAIKIAMQQVREIYPDPYYWGAFVILD